jgi:hypothetical protein
VGKKVSINRVVGSTVTALGSAVIDSTGRYSFPFATTKSDLYRFTVKKAAEGCGARGCAYGAAASPEVAVAVGLQVKARYSAKLSASPDVALVGTPVLFRGTVTPANAAQGKPVVLKRWNTKTGVYDSIATSRVKADGTVSFTSTPPKGTSRYVIFKPSEQCTSAGCAYVRSVSPAITVKSLTTVPYSVSVKAALSKIPVGATTTIRGVVSPTYASAGSRVTLQRIIGGKAAHVGTAAIGPRGDYSVRISSRVAGSLTYRLFKSADGCTAGRCDYTAGSSAPVTVTIVPVRSFTATGTASTMALVGQPVSLKASFAPAQVAAGNRVTLQQQVNGVWKPITIRTLDARGSIALSTTAKAAGKQSWRYVIGPDDCASGVCGYRGAVSPTMVLTLVASKQQQVGVSAQVSAASAKVGRAVTVSGRVAPASMATGATVTLRRQTGGVPMLVTSAKVAADGTYRLTLPAKTPGTWVYRVYVPPVGCGPYGCLYNGRVSGPVTVKMVP